MPPESPQVSLLHDSLMHIRGSMGEVGDIWRHEGLKKSVEQALAFSGQNAVGRWALELLVGQYSDSALQTSFADFDMDGPVGVAAGWDKPGKSILGWQMLGADHITIGGVTLHPQPGNPMPRLRTFDEYIGDHGTGKSLNSYGFSSPGAKRVVYNIARQREGGVDIPVIVQVTVNKEYYKPENHHLIPGVIAETVRTVMPVADGINLGLSSPNTLGMRDAQGKEFTYANVMAAKEVIGDDMPLGYKGDGDGGDERLDMYCDLAERTGLDYLELINTTALTHIKAKYGAEDLPGGLAGADPEYQDMAVNAVRYIYEAIGDRVDIMGMGGVNSGAQAEKMIRAGATGIGINTGIRALGARAMLIIKKDLSERITEIPEITNISQLIGIDTRRGPKVKAA